MAAGLKADLRSVRKAMKAMERAGANPRKVWRLVKKPMRKDQRDHMKAGEESSGAKWKPLASSTVQRRLSKGGRAGKFTKRGKMKKKAQRSLARILSKKLVSGAKFKVTRRSISITSIVPWAGIHQKGGRAGKGSRIPAREFFYVSDDLAGKAARLLARELATTYNKGG